MSRIDWHEVWRNANERNNEMATGDPPMHMINSNTLPCGCYTGVWMGVTPPPRCPQHSGEVGVVHPWTDTVTGTRLLPGVETDFTKIFERALARTANHAPILAQNHIHALGEWIGKNLGASAAKGDDGIAEHDCWQMALRALQDLRKAIALAEATKEGR